jgi:hypothetical protein
MTVFQLTEFAKDFLTLLRTHKLVRTESSTFPGITVTEYRLEKKENETPKAA